MPPPKLEIEVDPYIMENQSRQKKTLEIAREFLGKKPPLIFDRPLGSKHPKHGFVYEVNYGYVPGVIASDGEELDAYYLGTQESLEKVDGVVIAIIHRENDDDDKLIVVPDGVELSDDEIMKSINFQEKFFKSVIVRK
ncbi:MAG: inorganic pyrophosphatase [Patescibacteria group bacterium]|nr:inorganic pyrophosphatase [Patescibacteria group bacterium]